MGEESSVRASTVRAPMMVEVTSACCRTQANATAATGAPSSPAIRRSASSRPNVFSVRRGAADRTRPEPAGEALSREYFLNAAARRAVHDIVQQLVQL
jgi:hypothetical protein